jgi:hypothetical protein
MWSQTCQCLSNTITSLLENGWGVFSHAAKTKLALRPLTAAFRSLGAAAQLEANSYLAVTQFWDFPTLNVWYTNPFSWYD